MSVYVEHVKTPEWDRISESDLVCFSSLNAGADKTYRLAGEIRSRLGIPIIMGGTHASFFPKVVYSIAITSSSGKAMKQLWNRCNARERRRGREGGRHSLPGR